MFCREFSASVAFADPTELVRAERAAYVVAATILLDLGATDWAERDLVMVVCGPEIKFVVEVALARGAVAVPFLSASKTDTC